ncbi:hypothetical protein [Bordetella genomosp. 11]|uniref:General secretion pathway protein n=1 Tax=Bordetella genomosp. 11 TaxID=1416808 RepID=A0A261UKN6_9BORD|nr:hypothetical protein [Bordetella genomosp. 11]OZI62097.1 hypothetical protein CAL28_23005 [Bordetella genomosp. 11]
MKIPFPLTKEGIAARRFAARRADWYEYLADMIEDSEGKRTVKDIFAADAARYGVRTARGILSAYWAHRIDESGNLGLTFAGTLPRREVNEIAGMQEKGHAIFAEGLRDLAKLVLLTEKLRSILKSTLLVALLATVLLWLVVMVVVPYYTAPELLAAFPAIPTSLYGPFSRLFFGCAAWIAANSVTVWFTTIAMTVLFALSFPHFDGRVRRWLDRWGPYRLYRDIQAIAVVSTAATAVKRRSGVAVPLRDALQSQRAGATRWLGHRLQDMLLRLEDSRSGATVFDVGLIDQEIYWYLEDLTRAIGLDAALQKTRARLETTMLKRVESRAVALRWILLLGSVFALFGIMALHYAVIFDLRNATMLSAF